jgi:hypothetical protein
MPEDLNKPFNTRSRLFFKTPQRFSIKDTFLLASISQLDKVQARAKNPYQEYQSNVDAYVISTSTHVVQNALWLKRRPS